MVVSKRLGLGLRENAHAWLELDETVLTWEETLTGCLVLAGGAAAHRITEPVHAELSHHVDDEGYSFGTLGRLILLPRPHVVEPGVVQRFPLRFLIPPGVPFQGSVKILTGFRSGLFNQWGQQLGYYIQVVPPALCLLIAQQFADLTQMSVKEWEVDAGGGITARLVAADGPALFYTASLELSGHRIPNRVRLSVVTSRPRWGSPEAQQLDFRLGDPDPVRIREQFTDRLQRAGLLPGGTHNLPLPAGRPSRSGDDLPLPAASPPKPSGSA